jgi:tRNA G18 (ribose-2'-O)-methylase SpoU
MKIAVVLVDVRSIENVGSIFRTADGAGVEKIYLGGITPTPLNRLGKPREDLAKVALGAETSVAWEQVPNVLTLLKKLKKEGWQICAIEQDKNSKSFKKIPKSGKVLIVMGTEVTGLPKNILKVCDGIYEIPMKGSKESLNVSVAFGIAVYEAVNYLTKR